MYVGALDIGGTKTIVGVVDRQGRILKKIQFPTVENDCYKHLLYCLAMLNDELQELGMERSMLSGIGITLPGIVDSENGELIFAAFKKWKKIKAAAFVTENFGTERVFCENDVNACALGEQMFGLGQKYRNYIWMTVSTGVGGAVVCDAKLLRGFCGCAGEFGHIKVEYENPLPCPCGQAGCLEAHGSGTALNRLIREKIQEDPEFERCFLARGAERSGKGCAVLAREGNRKAQEIFHEIGEYLGRGISACVNVLAPEAVIIGGGVAASLDLLQGSIRRAIRQYTFEPVQDIRIEPTALGYEAAFLGAAALALQQVKEAGE